MTLEQQEIMELKKRVAALEGPKGAAAPPVHPASRTSVTHPPSQILLDPRMPKNADLLDLLSIVRSDYPSLCPDGWSKTLAMEYYRKDFAAFRMAARWLLDIGRGNLDLAHTVNYWADRAQGFSLFHGIKNVLIGGDLLTCAAIASGDVQFLNPDRYSANLMHLSLREGYGAGRLADAQAWRRILATEKAPAASSHRPHEYEKGGVVIRCAQ